MLFTRTAPSIQWRIRADLRGPLLDSNRLRIDEWRRNGQLEEIKNSPHRAIYRVQLPEIDCHIKHYTPGDWRSRVRELLRGCKARNEFALAERLADLGIATPAPIGWGRESDGLGSKSCWLITRTVPGRSLLQMLESESHSPSERQRLAESLGRFLALLHRAGVVHQDLHPGNILVTPSGEFSLLDLHCVRLALPVSWKQRRDNMVVFNRFFMLRASRTDRLRFWQAYSDASKIDFPADQAGREVERRTLASNLKFWHARDRRCLHENKYYRRIELDGAHGWRVSGLVDAVLQESLGQIGIKDARLLKSGPSSTVAEIRTTVGGRSIRAILKRFHRPRALDPLLARVRPSPALRSWINGHALVERCLPTARPLAVGRTANNETLLVTEFIDNAVELSKWIDGLRQRRPDEIREQLRNAIPAVARAIRELHERGLSHRDLKAANILVAPEGRIWFIDLVGVRRQTSVSDETRAANLTRLNASFVEHPLITRTDRLRFLRAYLLWALQGRGGWKEWWRRIADRTQAKVERNRRTGRVLA